MDGSTRPAPQGHEELTERWVGAGHLKVGDKLRLASGELGEVTALNTVQQTRVMYNLTVSEAHTYYVGQQGWLVHNCEPNIDPNKFSKYVLDPSNSKGKHVIYENLGYRSSDADTLVKLYRDQAAVKIKAGDFKMGKADQYGQRMTVEITIPGKGAAKGTSKTVLTGWIRDPDGTVRLTTLFTGFPK